MAVEVAFVVTAVLWSLVCVRFGWIMHRKMIAREIDEVIKSWTFDENATMTAWPTTPTRAT